MTEKTHIKKSAGFRPLVGVLNPLGERHMTTTTSRRAILAGIAAVPAIATSAPALGSPDAELLALGRSVEALKVQYEEASDLVEKLSKLAEPYFPPPFAWSEPPAEYADLWQRTPSIAVEMLPKDHPLIVWRETTREPDSARHDAYCKVRDEAMDEVEARFGCGAAEAHQGDLCGEICETAMRILTIRAHTVEGMMVKVRAFELSALEDEESRGKALESLAHDLRAMTGAA
jgi:hypothetical protein